MKKLSEIISEGYFKSLDTERQEKARLAKMGKKKTTSNSSEYKKKTSAPARSLSRMESTDAFKKTMDTLRDKKKKEQITTSDKQKLGAVAALMKRANEKYDMKKAETSVELEELGRDTLASYQKKASDARGHRGLPTAKVDNRYKGVSQASKKLAKKESVDEASDLHIKQAKGIAFDKRYKGGNMTGATNAIEKMKKGLSNHPEVRKALQRANESTGDIRGQYTSSSEKSQSGGHRPHLKNPEGKTSYLGGTAYKTKKHAAGEAQAYHDAYFKRGPGTSNEHGADSAVAAYREKHKAHIHVKESIESANPMLTFSEVAGQRGRPKRGESGESDQHIIMQLRSAQDLGGNKDIKFSNQKTAKVHPTHIDKILKAHDTLKMPRDKRKLRVAIGRSHEHLKRVADALK
jgi:hypothetical protein